MQKLESVEVIVDSGSLFRTDVLRNEAPDWPDPGNRLLVNHKKSVRDHHRDLFCKAKAKKKRLISRSQLCLSLSHCDCSYKPNVASLDIIS